MVFGDELGELDVRLIDFGVAKIKHITQESTIVNGRAIVGTPNYMSPDQAHGLPYSESSEIYSIGCVLFEILTGRPPFAGDTALETISLHAHQPPPALADAFPRGRFPRKLEDIVATCLAKEPAKRWASAANLAQALREFGNEADESTLVA